MKKKIKIKKLPPHKLPQPKLPEPPRNIIIDERKGYIGLAPERDKNED